MAGKRPEVHTEEFIQSRMEQQVQAQYELYGWATAVSVANPLDILIMIEESESDDEDSN